MSSLLERLREAVGMNNKKKTKAVKPKAPLTANQKAARQVPIKGINAISDRNAKTEQIAKDLEI